VRRFENTQAYFEKGLLLVSEEGYDALVRRISALEEANPGWITPDPPTQRVGYGEIGGAISNQGKYRHSFPMLSLGNTYWDRLNRNLLFCKPFSIHAVQTLL